MTVDVASAAEPSRGLLLVVGSDNLRANLASTLFGIGYSDRVVRLASLAEWSPVPGMALEWVFLDAGVVEDRGDLSGLGGVKNLVIFNIPETSCIRQQIDATLKPETFEPFRDLLTPAVLIERFGQQLAGPHFEHPPTPVRRASVTHMTPMVPPREPSPLLPRVARFLDHLNQGIHDNPERLISDFVRASSDVTSPDHQRALNRPPMPIEHALTKLRRHMLDRSRAKSGLLLIGKAGSGKTTMVHSVLVAEHQQQRIFGVVIDFTRFSARDLLQDKLVTLIDAFYESLHDKSPELLQAVATYPRAKSPRLLPILDRMVQGDDFCEIGEPSLAAQEALLLQNDRAFLAAMYLHYAQGAQRSPVVCRGYAGQGRLLEEAEAWYKALSQNMRKCLTLYLHFALRRTTFDQFESYAYRKFFEYLVTDCVSAATIVDSLPDLVRGIWPEQEPTELFHRFDAAGLAMAEQELSVDKLRTVCLEAIERHGKDRPVVLVLDNIDQRPHEEVEAQLVMNAIDLFSTQFVRRFANSRAVLSMRGTTFENQGWITDIVPTWTQMEVQPPDLRQVLERRCETWRRIGDRVGDGRAYTFTEDVVALVKASLEPARVADAGGMHPLLDVIRARHPYNVRKQLALFTECCRNVLLQKEALATEIKRDGLAPWIEKSYEFFVRVFLLGDQPFFREIPAGFLNLYDAGFPCSPFNACLRSWVLRMVPEGVTFRTAELADRLVRLGIPREEVEATIVAFVRHDLLRSEGHRKDYPVLSLSIWGEYFRKRIAFDLPYVSVIWWITPIAEAFSLGEPRLLLASELNSYAMRFVHWMRFEQQVALGELLTGAEEEYRQWEGGNPLHIFAELADNIQFSIHRIELSLGTR